MKKLTIGAASFIAGALLMTGISGYAAPALEKVSAYINNTVTLKLNGEKVETSQPILTYNDRTYVYLKDVGELVGAEVGWSGS
ncbi:stalk domain-containing protein [Paenibacillus sp. HB172176]|uniref:stalk domain-containing protein n=1 Tax=Paenibacillus sp. HB172176 TaxID=2493690 RepID=UPI00143C88FA|nr:stalk domain-containing protein [Paenibacillus sp. HB172176]